ncbi:MAG: Crp/Fnr family transcriptional regulator [Clostridia bacterium]|nr:Crp/Fnr family transcriptional regulator [Clostridia bacterium]
MNLENKEAMTGKYPAIKELAATMPDAVWERCTSFTMRPGEKIFRQGDDANRVYLICEGMISMYESDFNGKEMQVAFLNPGAVLGDIEILSGRTEMRFCAKAVSSAALFELPADAFEDWAMSGTEASRIFLRSLADKAMIMAGEVVLNVQSSAIEMLAARLVMAEPGMIRVTRSDLAQRCGVSIRTINRSVQRLEEEGYITLKHRKIYISKEQHDSLKASGYVNGAVNE